MTSSMLKAKDIPKRYWGETTSVSVYILNKCPTKKIIEKTPYEVRARLNPNVSHLRVFGSMYSKHVADKLRRNLDDPSHVTVLIGYHSTGAYNLYSPNDDKLVISRDVLVDERKGWNWTQGSV